MVGLFGKRRRVLRHIHKIWDRRRGRCFPPVGSRDGLRRVAFLTNSGQKGPVGTYSNITLTVGKKQT